MPPASTDISDDIQALTFDVFGTVVNWYDTVSKYIFAKAQADGLQLSTEGLSFCFARRLSVDISSRFCRIRERMAGRVHADCVSHPSPLSS